MMTLADVFESLLPAGFAMDRATLATIQLNDFVIDSRKVMRGDCFIALPGERVDGHDYVGHAIGRGAQVALVHQDLLKDDLPDVQWLDIRPSALAANPESLSGIDSRPCVIHVENTLAALQRLAAFWRAKF